MTTTSGPTLRRHAPLEAASGSHCPCMDNEHQDGGRSSNANANTNANSNSFAFNRHPFEQLASAFLASNGVNVYLAPGIDLHILPPPFLSASSAVSTALETSTTGLPCPHVFHTCLPLRLLPRPLFTISNSGLVYPAVACCNAGVKAKSTPHAVRNPTPHPDGVLLRGARGPSFADQTASRSRSTAPCPSLPPCLQRPGGLPPSPHGRLHGHPTHQMPHTAFLTINH
ncbi:hypothetical protein B0H10DRAFT_2214170 [Mycena sp. CBHHK59/15]|nr:hypothetical protein B0H10DRAFT_2214170 [Mycena sp. CBHHK59/15]